jgi:hypothetical protein
VVAIEVKPLEDELELVEEGNSILYVKPLLVLLVVLQRIVEVETVVFVNETFVDEILVELVVLGVKIGKVVVETWDIDTEPNG